MSRTSPTSSSRDLALVAVFAGIVAALGLVPAFSAFGGAVPITAQSLGVMLAGAVLGRPPRGCWRCWCSSRWSPSGCRCSPAARRARRLRRPLGRLPARLPGRGVRRGWLTDAGRPPYRLCLGSSGQRGRRRRRALRVRHRSGYVPGRPRHGRRPPRRLVFVPGDLSRRWSRRSSPAACTRLPGPAPPAPGAALLRARRCPCLSVVDVRRPRDPRRRLPRRPPRRPAGRAAHLRAPPARAPLGGADDAVVGRLVPRRVRPAHRARRGQPGLGARAARPRR